MVCLLRPLQIIDDDDGDHDLFDVVNEEVHISIRALIRFTLCVRVYFLFRDRCLTRKIKR